MMNWQCGKRCASGSAMWPEPPQKSTTTGRTCACAVERSSKVVNSAAKLSTCARLLSRRD
jgi:hypothetical protein